MSANYYTFKVGDMDCVALVEGGSVMGRAGVLQRFTEASEAEYEKAYTDIGLSIDEAESSLNILMVKVEGETVLVDAGMNRLLQESMRLAGISPESVTLVVITHTHGDHVQGLLTADGQPTFPNAKYIISKDEMVFWQHRMDTGMADHGAIVDMMVDKGLRLVEMDEEIMPCITAVPIPGHTPGQIGLLFESGGEKLLHLADLLHSPMQFAHPEWSPNFDADKSVSVPTRRKALQLAADQNTLTMFYHLPFPGLGRVKQSSNGFTWEFTL